MRRIIVLLLLAWTQCQPIPIVRNARARYVPELDIIYVEWQPMEQAENLMFTVRHKPAGTSSPWKYVKTSGANARLPMNDYNNADQVELQIKTEQNGRVLEDWTQAVHVNVLRKEGPAAMVHAQAPLQVRSPADPAAMVHAQAPQQVRSPADPAAMVHAQAPQQVRSPADPAAMVHAQAPQQVRSSADPAGHHAKLSPPLNFVAHIINPTSVQLEWQPVAAVNDDVYYIVNVKQLTTSSGSTLQSVQIKTAANSFTLGKFIAGEKYELTIRSATNKDSSMSSTAAIIEITMPREGDYFEIGNLIISSHFQSPSHGIVNLTWEVPPALANRIQSYNVEYSEMGTGYWQKIQFHGSSSSAVLHHLKSDTEYLLRIKTTMIDNMVTESGQFRFKTPKVNQNPIQKVDVIYSHDINSVKLQWMLQPHVNLDQVAGYDVYLSQDKDLPDSQWKVVRLNNKESSLSLEDLKSSTVYYVRVNVRNRDGSVMRAPSIYRFKTIDWSHTNNNSHYNPFD